MLADVNATIISAVCYMLIEGRHLQPFAAMLKQAESTLDADVTPTSLLGEERVSRIFRYYNFSFEKI
ncbi:uncharacterized [Tachysurus ichikawai]